MLIGAPTPPGLAVKRAPRPRCALVCRALTLSSLCCLSPAGRGDLVKGEGALDNGSVTRLKSYPSVRLYGWEPQGLDFSEKRLAHFKDSAKPSSHCPPRGARGAGSSSRWSPPCFLSRVLPWPVRSTGPVAPHPAR